MCHEWFKECFTHFLIENFSKFWEISQLILLLQHIPMYTFFFIIFVSLFFLIFHLSSPSSPNFFHFINQESIKNFKSKLTNCSRVATPPLEISQIQNISKSWIVKYSGMVCFQDWISYSNEPYNSKKVNFLTMGPSNEKLRLDPI